MYELLLTGLGTIVHVKYLVPLFLGTLAGVIGGACSLAGSNWLGLRSGTFAPTLAHRQKQIAPFARSCALA